MNYKILTYSTAILALFAVPMSVQADTVTTKTLVQAKALPNTDEINFSAFDANGDGEYSMQEVGERLFDVFDVNNDRSIDNIEWDHKSMMTITPMEQETYKFVDHNDDGVAEHVSYTREEFFQTSGLIKFDENYNGLSASEFIGVGFQELDDDDDNMINLEEWKEAYIESRTPLNAEPERYNN